MFRTTMKAAWSRKRRLLGTALAVVLGVAFLTATLVLSDSAKAGFRTAFTEANEGTDALVRSETRLSGSEQVVGAPIDASLLTAAGAVDGVAAVAPSVEGVAQVLDADGEPIGGDGPPTFATNWINDPALNGWDLAEGRAPAAPGEVVLDRGSADEAGVAVGDTATVLVPEPIAVTVVGIATIGGEDSLGGTTFVGFETTEAQRLLLGSTDRLTGVVVGADGLSEDELVSALDAALPDGVEAISGAALTAEQEADIESDFLGFMRTALLVFAFVALLVAAFSIFNTFSILVAQRTRESALLRALGASRRQVLASAVGEAAIVGAIGSVAGLGAGLLVASGLLGLLDAAGLGLPVDGLALSGGTIVTAFVVGMVVTLAGGLAPAWKASRVAPLAALRDVAVDGTGASRWRAVVGLTGVAAGTGLVLSGTSGGSGLGRAGIGALVLIVGVVLLGPVVARPIGSTLGAPLRLRGVSGDLARRNAVRNPRRTSGTAAALLVGVGVVSLFTVFAASVSASIDDAVRRSFGGDLVVSPSGWGGAGLSAGLVDQLGELPEVDTAAGMGWGGITLDGDDDEAGFGDPAALSRVADFDVEEGDLASLDESSFAISVEVADEHGWTVGSPVTVGFADGSTEVLTVAVTYRERAMLDDVLIPLATWRDHNPQVAFFAVLVGLDDGVSLADGRSAVESVTGANGGPDVMDRDEFIESEAGEIDALLTVIYGLLAVAIVIALMGIANTLSLSVHERTRELGLLRAVGQTRSQLRAMVRWESVIVATFGAIGGLGIGTFLGWGLVRALNAAEGFGTFALPVGSMLTVLLVGAAVGVVAGLRPAWRASRLDVLTAVAAD